MEQYDRILNAYRRPGDGQDDLVTSCPRQANEQEHAVVMYKGYVRDPTLFSASNA